LAKFLLHGLPISEIRMSSALDAVLLTVSLATGGVPTEKPVLPRPIIEAGLKKAGCTTPAKRARIVGSERLSPRLEIVEVTCWRAAYNSGSILFAVPENRPQDAELLAVEHWQGGQVRQSYSVSAPAFDAKTRTLSSTHMTRGAGDCGTIQEMKWTGWHFRLVNAWNKDNCDGEPFEWDSREEWQVFPAQGLEPDPEGLVLGRDHAQTAD
jgi:hypothetical protein